MIKTSRQLKDKVRNMSGSDSNKAQALIRNFIMERFLERISLSEYKNNFILKGGMLVSAVMGIDVRATMDIDTTVRALPLTLSEARKVVENIIAVYVPDGVSFSITKSSEIMEGHEYPGLRFMLEARLDNMKQTIKSDISTGDVITPAAVMYSYKLMFENRTIPIWTYNLETLLGEKIETIVVRGTANTRMRDFYDVHIILSQEANNLKYDVLKEALRATSEKRGSTDLLAQAAEIMKDVLNSATMQKDWENYKRESFFVGDLSWVQVVESVRGLIAESLV